MKVRIRFIMIVAIAVPCISLSAKTIRIPADYPKIQSGIDSAKDGDTVLVADGVYESTDEYNTEVVNFRGKKIVVKSENGPKNCILKKGDDVVRFNSGETHRSVLDGFTLTDADPGAAIECYRSSPTIINNIICNNWSEYGLGAIYLENSSAVLMDNEFFGNKVYGECAGIICSDSTIVTITNSTFFGGSLGNSMNSAFVGVLCDSNSSAMITNSIFWHSGSLGFDHCTILYSCIDKEVAGTNNIYTYPEFADTIAFNFSLKANSKCINAGTEDTIGLNLPRVDILGKNRIFNKRIDIGAYEFQNVVSIHNTEMLSIEIFPIPAKDKANIKFNRLTGNSAIIEIYSLNGKKIFSKSIPKTLNLTIDLTGNPKGVYILCLTTDGEIFNKKICIE